MSEHIRKSHNKTLLLYHLVFPAKYRRKIFTDEIELTLREVCTGIGVRYEMNFIEIGLDGDHVHFLVQGIPTMSVTRLVTIIKSITAKEIFKNHSHIKKILWGGSLWTTGYYANTVGQYAGEETIRNYVKNQGKEKEYKKIHEDQLTFDFGVS
ncbi:MAG: IS200/IS605 family transposase [Lentisphaerales bacterium]|nr:IS200/IS605 family transposase [Lentisphaerales bacterium]